MTTVIETQMVRKPDWNTPHLLKNKSIIFTLTPHLVDRQPPKTPDPALRSLDKMLIYTRERKHFPHLHGLFAVRLRQA